MDAREFFKVNADLNQAFIAADSECFATEDEAKVYGDARNLAVFSVSRTEIENTPSFFQHILLPQVSAPDYSAELYGRTSASLSLTDASVGQTEGVVVEAAQIPE